MIKKIILILLISMSVYARTGEYLLDGFQARGGGTLIIDNIESVDSIDNDTETTIENALDTLPNVTSIQSQSISLSGPLTVESASTTNQDTTTDASPSFTDLTLSTPSSIYSLSHDSFADFVAGEHFLQTDITNVSTALSTGLLKVTTGTGALSVVTDYVSGSDFTGDGVFLVGTGAGTYQAESGNTARTSLGLGSGNDVVFTKVSGDKFNVGGLLSPSTAWTTLTNTTTKFSGGGSLGFFYGYLGSFSSFDGTFSTAEYIAFKQLMSLDSGTTNKFIGFDLDIDTGTGGTVNNDLIGFNNDINLQSGMTLSGDVFGYKAKITATQDPSGAVYGYYLEESGANVDYGFYQNGSSPNYFGGDLSVGSGTGEITTGSINRASGTLTLEIGGTPELSIATGVITVKDGGKIKTDKIEAYDAAGLSLVEDGGLGITIADSTGNATFGGNIVIPDSGYIGSSSDTDAIQIEADGDIVLSQNLAIGSTGPSVKVEISDVGDNSVATCLKLVNTDEGADTETGAGIKIQFDLIGTRDSGESYEQVQAAAIIVGKDDDWWHGSNRSPYDGNMQFWITSAATAYQRMTLTSAGILVLPEVYGHDMNGETIRDLKINDSGELGYADTWVHVDLSPEAVNIPTSNPPDNDEYQGFSFDRFDRGTEEQTYYTWDIPETFKAGSASIRIHFTLFVENPPSGTGDEAVVMGFEYKKLSDGDTFDFSSGTSSGTATETIADTESAYELHVTSDVACTTTGWAAGDTILLRFYRDATNVNDTYDNEAVGTDNDAWIKQYHLEYLTD